MRGTRKKGCKYCIITIGKPDRFKNNQILEPFFT
jgi:hypothetical protein